MTQYNATDDKTRATTIGVLPDVIGALLLVLGAIGVLSIGTAFGFSPVTVLTVFTAGISAAVGLRLTTATSSTYSTFGIGVIWVSALIFTLGTVLIVAETDGAVAWSFIIATTIALVSYGIVGNTITTFGHGTVRRVLGRYLAGTVVLIALTLTILVGGIAISAITSNLRFIGGAATGGSELNIGAHARAFTAVGIYTGLLIALHNITKEIPIEILVSPVQLEEFEQRRQQITNGYKYAFIVVCLYFLMILTSAVLSETGEGSETIRNILETIIVTGSYQPILVVTGIIVLVSTVLLCTVYIFERLSSTPTSAVLEIVVPPGIIALTGFLIAPLFETHLHTLFIESGFVDSVEDDGSQLINQLIVGEPSVMLLLLVTAALLLSAIVFSLPTLVASVGPGDVSLTGIAISVAALSALVTIAIIVRVDFITISIGIIIAAVIWELGEYTTVAVGELDSPTTTGLPDGFTSVVAVHGVATAIVSLVAILFAIITTVIFSGITIPTTTASVILLVLSVNFVILLRLLPG